MWDRERDSEKEYIYICIWERDRVIKNQQTFHHRLSSLTDDYSESEVADEQKSCPK